MILRRLIIFPLLFAGLCISYAQELNCIFSINSSQLQGTTNQEIFNTLRDELSDFMNNTAWTNHVFEVNERIETTFMLNVTEESSADVYKATLTVQARRPAYGTSYNTVMLNFIDDNVNFKYIENDPLEFSENRHVSNLPAILAYYAYIIIGIDYDSFSSEGGTPYFQKAEKIVNNAQSSPDVGWKAFEDRSRKNRYWLINNILDADYKPLRSFIYTYHRLGLDVMDKAVDQGRLVIKDALLQLEKFHKSKPDPFMYFYQLIISAKADEITQIFSEAPPQDKARIYNIMTEIDPANTTKYESLRGN